MSGKVPKRKENKLLTSIKIVNKYNQNNMEVNTLLMDWVFECMKTKNP